MRLGNPSLYRSLRPLSIFSGTRRRLALAFMLTAALLIFVTSAFASISFLLTWGSSTPTGIAVDSSGNVYVAEWAGSRFQKFDSSGNVLLQAGIPGDVPGGFITPSGIAVDSLGNIYVSDSTTDRVSKFNSSGTFVTTWGGLGEDDGQFMGASGVAVDSANNIYVSDTYNQRIQKFNSDGGFITKWGSGGTGEGQFNGPQGLAIDSSNNVYVADTGNNRIQKFSSAGVFITKFGTAGSGTGQLSSPYGVSAASGTVFVADGGNSRLQSFSATGTFIEAVGSEGDGDEQFVGPQDVAADAFGNIYVADTFNDRVQKLTAGALVIAKAGLDQTVECSGAVPSVTLDGTASTGGGTLTYTWKEGMTVLGSGAMLAVSLPAGSHTITLTVTSSAGGSADDTVVIDVVDTVAPTITLNGPNPMTVECHTGFSDPGASASDGCAGDLTSAITVGGIVKANVPGTYTITYSVTDGSHPTVTTRTVNVVDTLAPTITLNGSNPMTVECHTGFSDPGATASDGCAGDLTSAITVAGNVNANVVGTYTRTYSVSDGTHTTTNTRTVNVVDTLAPTITLNGSNPMTVECHTGFTDPGATASDGCAGNLTSAITAAGSVNVNVVGTYTRTYSVSDGSHTTTTTRMVKVVDTTPPVIRLNGQTPSMSPANHKYQTFLVTNFVTSVADSCGTSLGVSAVVISKVTSDEPENSAGNAQTTNDIVIAADCRSVQLRSESDGGGNGRVYTITFRVVDASGNTTTATARVTVPHGKGSAVDDGPHYTVMGTCP